MKLASFVPVLHFGLWLALAGAAMGAMWRHEATPSPAATATAWPGASALDLDRARPTIVLFAHPDCPCTRASLDGLAGAIAAHPGRARVEIVVTGTPGAESPNVSRAREIARLTGATVVADPDGALARRFGAVASGQTFAFSPAGRPLFRGGLTALRGEAGPSRGLDALAEILTAGTTRIAAAPVLGCALVAPAKPAGGAR